jgi:hypothetical protein
MWEFYLAGAESAFRVEKQVVFQFQLARKVDSVPLTRGYFAEREAAPRARRGGLGGGAICYRDRGAGGAPAGGDMIPRPSTTLSRILPRPSPKRPMLAAKAFRKRHRC